MKKTGFYRGILVFVIALSFLFQTNYNTSDIGKYITFTIISALIITVLRQTKEHQNLSNLIEEQRENYKSVLKHEIKTPVLAQIRAIELLLKGNFGKLNKQQKEMLRLTLNSCKHSYKIIHSQLYL